MTVQSQIESLVIRNGFGFYTDKPASYTQVKFFPQEESFVVHASADGSRRVVLELNNDDQIPLIQGSQAMLELISPLAVVPNPTTIFFDYATIQFPQVSEEKWPVITINLGYGLNFFMVPIAYFSDLDGALAELEFSKAAVKHIKKEGYVPLREGTRKIAMLHFDNSNQDSIPVWGANQYLKEKELGYYLSLTFLVMKFVTACQDYYKYISHIAEAVFAGTHLAITKEKKNTYIGLTLDNDRSVVIKAGPRGALRQLSQHRQLPEIFGENWHTLQLVKLDKDSPLIQAMQQLVEYPGVWSVFEQPTHIFCKTEELPESPQINATFSMLYQFETSTLRSLLSEESIAELSEKLQEQVENDPSQLEIQFWNGGTFVSDPRLESNWKPELEPMLQAFMTVYSLAKTV